MTTDFSFDERVADIYNHQRQHPAEVSQQIGEAIAHQLTTPAQLLEIGIGTGRIAYPTARAGIHVTGFDLSPQMLQRVPNLPNLTIAQADMHHLPYPSNHFDAVLLVHVIHLAQDWQAVMREIKRVLKPDGILIQGSDWIDPQSLVGILRQEFRMHAVRLDPSLMPPAAGISKADYLAELGATNTEKIIAAEWHNHLSPNDRLTIIGQRIDAESWILTDTQFTAMMTHLHDYARQKWHNLDEKQQINHRFALNITHGNW